MADSRKLSTGRLPVVQVPLALLVEPSQQVLGARGEWSQLEAHLQNSALSQIRSFLLNC